MTTAIHRQVELARDGDHPWLIRRMRSGIAVIAQRQVVRGYSLLLPDPVVADLNALPPTTRVQFLDDMALLGDALLTVTGAARINYEILGNLDPALHVHVVPRYDDEDEALRTRPFWFYDWNEAVEFDPDGDADLVRAIADEIERLI